MADILNTEKYLPPYTEIKIDLERGHPTMCILSPDEDLKVKIQVLEINMSCRRFVPNSVIALQNEKKKIIERGHYCSIYKKYNTVSYFAFRSVNNQCSRNIHRTITVSFYCGYIN